MDTQTYPGKGLSPLQLVFALNEELKRAVDSPSYVKILPRYLVGGCADFSFRFTLDDFSQLERDTLAALTTIREWLNPSVPINRVPLDVLSLIPTHLPSQADRFRASFVCRRWRITFLQNARLWSYIRLSKGEIYAKTLLERAKGSPLTILASGMVPVNTIKLLLPRTNQIVDLEFANGSWADIRKFTKIIPGPFPLLRTLNIGAVRGIGLDYPLFSGSVESPILISPNLTSFELSVSSEGFYGSQLLDFLEASPMLRAVRMKIIAPISLEGISQGTLIVLHNVESFCLVARDGASSYKLTTHISCPSAKHTSLTHTRSKEYYLDAPLEKFPSPAKSDAIIRQYTRTPIEEVTLKTITNSDYFIACSLTFVCTDATVVELCFEMSADDEDPDTSAWEESFSAMYLFAFSGASETIQGRPLLANIKRFHIHGPHTHLDRGWMINIAQKFGDLFRSLGPLEELTICHCDIQPFPFFDCAERRGPREHTRYTMYHPPIKTLTISYPLDLRNRGFLEDLAEFAEVRHERGTPFERVTICMDNPPMGMEKRLRPWVGTVDCYRVPYDRRALM